VNCADSKRHTRVNKSAGKKLQLAAVCFMSRPVAFGFEMAVSVELFHEVLAIIKIQTNGSGNSKTVF
jgi:hypothetical protein